jgi:hypothetical protein
VQAGEEIIRAADTGVGHWSDHVEAQTKANRDKITVTMMDKIFDKTREAGPSDQEHYQKARKAYEEADGSCEPVKAAPAKIRANLRACRERGQRQEAVLRAAEPAMADWKSHLAQMEHSREHPQPDDQEVWLRTWKAAPPHIDAFERALERFHDDESSCRSRS